MSIVSDIPREYSLTANSLILWRLGSFPHPDPTPFFNVPWALHTGVALYMYLLGLGSTILETSVKNSSKYKNKSISLYKICQILITEGETFKEKLDCLNSSQEHT